MNAKRNIIFGLIALFSVCAKADETRGEKALWLLEDHGYEVIAGDWHFSANQLGEVGGVFFPQSVTQQWTLADVDAVSTTNSAFIAWKAARDETEAQPTIFAQGIEIPYGKLFVLPTQTNAAGRAVFSDDIGGLFTAQVHGSPWKTKAEIDAMIQSNVTKRASSRVSAITKGNQAKTDAAAANSIPALRAAVVLLQEQIEEMQRLMGIRE